jgi:hypothetical protein
MSKVLDATCSGGVVVANGLPLPDAKVLSEGVGQSEGIAVLDEDKVFYLAKISPDLKTLLEHVVDALTQVSAALDKAASALTTLDTKGFLIGASGAVPSTPSATSDITAITTSKGEIDTIKGQIQSLGGILK